jgi:hypothetical protein
MVDWTQPTITTVYTNVLTELEARDVDSATLFIGSTSTNIPTNAIRLDSTSGYALERWNGSAWVAQDLTIIGGFYLDSSNPVIRFDNTSAIQGSRWDIVSLASDSSLRIRIWDITETSIAIQHTFSPNGNVSFAGDIAVTGTVDGIDIATDVAANTLKVTNATHTGEVIGSGSLSLTATAITSKAELTSGLSTNDEFLISDSGVLKRMDASVFKDFLSSEITAYTAQQTFTRATVTDGATVTWLLGSAQVGVLTLGGNRTMASPGAEMKNGGTYVLFVIQDATGSRTLTWDAVYKWAEGITPVLSTAANAIDILTFVSDGTNMYGVAQKAFS